MRYGFEIKNQLGNIVYDSEVIPWRLIDVFTVLAGASGNSPTPYFIKNGTIVANSIPTMQGAVGGHKVTVNNDHTISWTATGDTAGIYEYPYSSSIIYVYVR